MGRPYFVDVLLYNGQRLTTKDAEDLPAAALIRDQIVYAAMVESATIIDADTGECVPHDGVVTLESPAARWRHKPGCPKHLAPLGPGFDHLLQQDKDCTCHG